MSTLLALLLRYASIGFLDTVMEYAVNDHCDQKCLEVQAAYRICFALFLFFLLTTIMALISTALHLGQWILKFMIWLGLSIGMFFVPDDVVEIYVHIARGGSSIFLLLQILVLITMAYELNRRWTEDEIQAYLMLVLVISAILFIGSIVVLGFFYSWFGGDGCSTSTAFITITLIVCVMFTLISISNIAPHGAILTSSVVTAYCTFVLYGSLSSNPDSKCNSVNLQSGGWNVAGLVIAAITLAYRAWSLNRNSLFNSDEEEIQVKATSGKNEDIEMATRDDDGGAGVSEDDLSPEEASQVRSTNLQFHVLMTLASLYVTMVVSNWGADSLDASSQEFLNISETVMWVGSITGWITMALYTWTLIAPRVCSGRDFGVDLDD